MDPKVWNGTDRICLTYLSTQTQNTPFIGSTFLRPAYGIWKRKNVGGVKKENMWPFGLGSLMFFKVTQAQFGKNLDENLAKNELENLHKRNLSRFKFSIFIPVSPPVRKKILVLLPLLLLLFLPGPSFKFNQLKFITRTDLPQQNIWAIEQTLIGIRKMT